LRCRRSTMSRQSAHRWHSPAALYSPQTFLFLSLAVMISPTVKWSEFLAIDPEVPGSILGATRFLAVCLKRGLFSLMRITGHIIE
jgi:hypothetical protein